MARWIKLPSGLWVNLTVMGALQPDPRCGQLWGKLFADGYQITLDAADYEFVQQRLQELQFDYVDQHR